MWQQYAKHGRMVLYVMLWCIKVLNTLANFLFGVRRGVRILDCRQQFKKDEYACVVFFFFFLKHKLCIRLWNSNAYDSQIMFVYFDINRHRNNK